ncbi:hypothetical protein J7I94_07635 [Streptomyces sp. ISL-12]|uniref:hypothetical protein n=1 Tax=Streptomyces sp. ISL-12 TaxID=2819177 RepID=UPI001BE5A923|nr:hypothetical protein [Streptomyces sp. ISL-12]MBT2410431.1 hypothetical protein [Streptomyces sp. ISL-12]
MDTDPTTPAPRRLTRLLPWSGPEGKPCYLITDGSGRGYVSRVADRIESVQLGMGAELVSHAQALLSTPEASAGELRFLSARLTEALQDALRVAESRGARLPVPDAGDEHSPRGDTDLPSAR